MWGRGKQKTFTRFWTLERIEGFRNALTPSPQSNGTVARRQVSCAIAALSCSQSQADGKIVASGYGWVGLGDLGLTGNGQLPVFIDVNAESDSSKYLGWISLIAHDERDTRDSRMSVSDGIRVSLSLDEPTIEWLLNGIRQHHGGESRLLPIVSCVLEPFAWSQSEKAGGGKLADEKHPEGYIVEMSLTTWACSSGHLPSHPYFSLEDLNPPLFMYRKR